MVKSQAIDLEVRGSNPGPVSNFSLEIWNRKLGVINFIRKDNLIACDLIILNRVNTQTLATPVVLAAIIRHCIIINAISFAYYLQEPFYKMMSGELENV